MEGDTESLLQEGRTIQARLPMFTQVSEYEGGHARSVAKLIGKGSIQAAIRRVTDKGSTGTLPQNSFQPDNQTVKENLFTGIQPRPKPSAKRTQHWNPIQ